MCGEQRHALWLEVDHIVPLFNGGHDTASNLQLLCLPCHLIKSRAEAAKGSTKGKQYKHKA